MVALALAGLAVLTRASVRTTSYYSVDAGLLAGGILDYDFDIPQPHPPYYPLVVAFARLLAPFVGPLAALTWLAIASSAILAAGVYAVTRRFAGPATAMFASLVVLASPVALRNGAVPLSYALEGASSVVVAGLAWRCRERMTVGAAVAIGMAMSVAVGIRPSSLFLLGPLALWGVWGGVRQTTFAVGAGGALTLAWLVPMLVSGGGLGRFLLGNGYQGRAYILADPVWEGGWPAVLNHAQWLAYHVQHTLPFAIGLGAACFVGSLRVRHHWPARTPSFLAAWVLPGLGFYLLVYAGWPVYPDGYLMALVPALAVLAALALRALCLAVSAPGVPLGARAIGIAVVLLLAIQPATWTRDWDQAMAPARASERWEASWADLEQAFPPNETALVSFHNAQWLRLEHPDYLVWSPQLYGDEQGRVRVQVQQEQHRKSQTGFFSNVADGVDDAPHPIPSWVRRVAVVDGHPLEGDFGHIVVAVDPQVEVLPSGARVTWFDAGQVATIEEALTLYEVDLQSISPRVAPPQG